MEAHGFVGDAAEPAVELSRSAKILAVLALSLAIVLFALDGTMVTVAVPRMVGDLGNEDLLSWIGTAYLLTSTAFGPLWGRLGDVLGRKALFLANIVVFMLASIICAVAPNMITLIVGRALQGVGGGGAFLSTAERGSKLGDNWFDFGFRCGGIQRTRDFRYSALDRQPRDLFTRPNDFSRPDQSSIFLLGFDPTFFGTRC